MRRSSARPWIAPSVAAIAVALASPAASAAPSVDRRDVPPEGLGLVVGGAIALAGGIGMAAGGFGESCSTCGHDFNRNMGYAGIATAAVGGALAAGGGVLKQRFNGWRDAAHLRVPKRGNGLFVGGGSLLGFAIVAFAATPNSPRAAIPGVLWSLGGIGMIAGGAVLRARFGRWKRDAPQVALAPMLGRGQLGLAMAARF